MKKIIWIFILGFLFACKQESTTETDHSTPENKVIELTPNEKEAKESYMINPEGTSNKIVKKVPQILPEFVPADGKSNWHAVYNESNEHLVGIFRLSDQQSWREFMATMHFAESEEIYKSMVWQPESEEWWTKRDVLANIKSRNLLAYKREDKTGNWYFAFNSRNYEVYFWR